MSTLRALPKWWSGSKWWPDSWPLQPVPRVRWAGQRPTYREARPALIRAALDRALARPSGNWYVFAASDDVRRDRPYGAQVAGAELVAWRDQAGELIVGPGSCPHLGAPLASAAVHCGALVCRWHGLSLGPDGGFGWYPLPSYDDGVLAWVRLDAIGGEEPLEAPVVPERPTPDRRLHGVASMTGSCEASDIVENRLDPWHGAWFHPYSFAHLEVRHAPSEDTHLDAEDRYLVSVTFRVGRLGVPVLAEFTCPDPRTIVMRIVAGEGVGSVVETHATPLGPAPDGRPRTAVVEAVIAASGRPGFALARAAAPALRPAIRRAAKRLWRDDLAYAERRYRLRSG